MPRQLSQRLAAGFNQHRMAWLSVVALVLYGFWEYGRSNAVYIDLAFVDAELSHLHAPVSGQLLARQVQLYQPVTAGTELISLDPAPWQHQISLAQSEVARLQLAFSGQQLELERLQAQYRQWQIRRDQAALEQRQAATEWQRLQQLQQVQHVSAQQTEQLKLRVQQYQAQAAELQQQQQQVQLTQTQQQLLVQQQQQQVQQAVAVVQDLQRQLALLPLKSTEDAIVSAWIRQPGDFVQQGERILTLTPARGHWITAYVDERWLGSLQPGMAADIEFDARPGERFAGKIRDIAPLAGARLSPIQPNFTSGHQIRFSQRVPVRLDIVNPAALPLLLRPGMAAKVWLQPDRL